MYPCHGMGGNQVQNNELYNLNIEHGLIESLIEPIVDIRELL